MSRLPVLLLMLFCAAVSFAQPNAKDYRGEALESLESDDAERRVEAVIWFAAHGKPVDAEMLVQHLTDESPTVRTAAEQGLWVLWSRSGDKAVDTLMERGEQEVEAGELKRAIATFSEVIRRKPDFAEGWNKRATAEFLTGDLRQSLADCGEVLKRNRYHFGALAGYGQIYFQLEQYSKAIEYWRRALRVNPNMDGVEKSIKGTEELLDERRKQSV